MRGRKRRLPQNYEPPAYIDSSDHDHDEPPLQRQREVHHHEHAHLQQGELQPEARPQQQPPDDENFWIDIDNDLFMSDDGEDVVNEDVVRGPGHREDVVRQQGREHVVPDAAVDEGDEPHHDDDYVSSDDDDPEQQGKQIY